MAAHTDVLLSVRREVLQIADTARALREDLAKVAAPLAEEIDAIVERAQGCCQHIDAHLAPALRDGAPPPRATALAAVLTEAIREVEHRGLCPAGAVRTTFEDGPLVHAGRDSVRHIILSLLTDACRHARPDTPVQVRVHADGAAAYVDILHEGLRAEVQRLEVLWPEAEHGAVDDEAFGAGVTLTLRLVRVLVDAHGGHLTMTRSGPRVTVTVCLPTAAGGPKPPQVIDLRDRAQPWQQPPA